MRLLIAPDKFKGSLAAGDVALAMASGAGRANPDIEIDLAPMADGGEGTVEALVAATHGQIFEATVRGPLGEPVVACFGLLGDGETAVVEMAAASGLVLVPKSARDPMRASTFGTGELLLAALDAGAKRVILGIGGSATNDGGAGLAQAIGVRLIDRNGTEIERGGGTLANLDRIDASNIDPRIVNIPISVACDVDNPLCGPRGASAVYGPQKGADREMVDRLDRNLGRLAEIIQHDLDVDVLDLPGGGAAGGLGAGLVAFAGGKLEPGIDLVIRAVGLANRLRGADLCLTGEGSLDASSAFGKTAVGVARLARSLGVPTIALAGGIGEDMLNGHQIGFDAYFSICPRPASLDEAILRASDWIADASEQVLRAFLAARRK